MGRVSDKTALRPHRLGEPIHHPVKSMGQLSDFIPPLRQGNPLIQVPVRNGTARGNHLLQLVQGGGNRQEPQNRTDEENEKRHTRQHEAVSREGLFYHRKGRGELNHPHDVLGARGNAEGNKHYEEGRGVVTGFIGHFVLPFQGLLDITGNGVHGIRFFRKSLPVRQHPAPAIQDEGRRVPGRQVPRQEGGNLLQGLGFFVPLFSRGQEGPPVKPVLDDRLGPRPDVGSRGFHEEIPRVLVEDPSHDSQQCGQNPNKQEDQTAPKGEI